MKALLVIFSYAGQDEMLDRHWQSFEAAGCETLLVSPEDAPCKRPGLLIGRSEHHGTELMRRVYGAFAHVLAGPDRPAYWFVEGDSVVARPAPQALDDGVHGYLFDNCGNPNFRGKEYIHWAWGMNRATLERVYAAAQKHELGEEAGSPDRHLAWVCESAGIKMRHRSDISFSRNIIQAPDEFFDANMLIKNGGMFIHGIKHKWQLERLKLPFMR